MNSSELLSAFRVEMRDIDTVPFFTDAEIYTLINEAQNDFCRLTKGIADSTTPAVTRINATAGVAFVNLHPSILKIRQVVRLPDYDDVRLLNFENIQAGGVFRERDYGCSWSVRMDNSTGTVTGFVLGMEANKARLIRIPAIATTLNLVVYRLPIDEITGESQDLEIDLQHHRSLLLDMKAKALLKQDAETFDFGKAVEYQQAFEQYCSRANAEKGTREHTYRTMGYGGI